MRSESAQIQQVDLVNVCKCAVMSALVCYAVLCRHPEDYKAPQNLGLEPAIKALKELRSRHVCITFSDLITLGGVVAIEAAGGELLGKFRRGRHRVDISHT